jgi:thiol-disulfide isomerase/thioredoxin
VTANAVPFPCTDSARAVDGAGSRNRLPTLARSTGWRRTTSYTAAPRGAATIASLLVTLIGLLAGCTTQTAADEKTRTGSQTGFVSGESVTLVPTDQRRPAPILAGSSLSGGGPVSTADYPGKVIVINVWGSWCAPCRKEAPDLGRASKQTADIAQFIGLNIRDYDRAPARAFIRAFAVPYPQIYDPNGEQLIKFADLPPSGIPSTLIIDPKGRIAARVIGTITETTLVQMIQGVAAE